MLRRRKLVLGGLVLLLTSLLACDGVKGFGVGPWPLYRERARQSELSDAEKSAIADKLTDDQLARLKDLFESEAYYRNLIVVHNQKAIEQRTKIEKNIGTDDEDIKAYQKVWQARIAPKE